MRVDWAGAIENENLGKIFIGGEEFTGIGYQGLMTVNTKTYVTEPTRANDGSIPNIDDHDTFVVPRCKVNFKFFNIRDYQRLCRVVNSANQFPVKYFDKQFGEHREYMMYMEPEEMAKMFNVGTSVIGLLDYEVSFIGTLNNLEKFKVVYVPKYWNGTSLVDLNPKVMDYSSNTTYSKGQKVYWNGGYYEAIYYENSFKSQTPPNSTYWEVKVPTLWNDVSTYNTGDLVYVDTTSGGVAKRKYYEAKKDNFYGFLTSNTSYWSEVSISQYLGNKTYTRGNYVYVGDGSNRVFYQAIYYVDTFSGQSPDNVSYWTKINVEINKEIEIHWGNSIKVLTGSYLADFYQIPNDKMFKGWNTLPDGSGLTLLPNANWSVFENTTIYPIIGV
jgi:hypothetical protein